MRILYLSSEEYGSLTWSLMRAFTDLGCEVVLADVIGTKELGPLKRESLPARVAQRAFRGPIAHAIERRLRRDYLHEKFDLIFFHKTLLLPPEVLLDLKAGTGAKLFAYYPDHPVDSDPVHCNANTKNLIPYLDYAFVFGRHLIAPLFGAGARRVEALPFAYDPKLHYPVQLSPAERDEYRCEVAFVGAYSIDRAAWFRHLLDRNLGLWGPGWKKALSMDKAFRKAIRGGARVGLDFVRCYLAADIGLNIVQSCQGGDGHNMRTFEAAASGGFVMSNRTTELLQMFTEGENIVCFSSPEELSEKVAYYLAEPKERQRIAKNAWKRIEGETYLLRAKRILEVLEGLKEGSA